MSHKAMVIVVAVVIASAIISFYLADQLVGDRQFFLIEYHNGLKIKSVDDLGNIRVWISGTNREDLILAPYKASLIDKTFSKDLLVERHRQEENLTGQGLKVIRQYDEVNVSTLFGTNFIRLNYEMLGKDRKTFVIYLLTFPSEKIQSHVRIYGNIPKTYNLSSEIPMVSASNASKIIFTTKNGDEIIFEVENVQAEKCLYKIFLHGDYLILSITLEQFGEASYTIRLPLEGYLLDGGKIVIDEVAGNEALRSRKMVVKLHLENNDESVLLVEDGRNLYLIPSYGDEILMEFSNDKLHKKQVHLSTLNDTTSITIHPPTMNNVVLLGIIAGIFAFISTTAMRIIDEVSISKWLFYALTLASCALCSWLPIMFYILTLFLFLWAFMRRRFIEAILLSFLCSFTLFSGAAILASTLRVDAQTTRMTIYLITALISTIGYLKSEDKQISIGGFEISMLSLIMFASLVYGFIASVFDLYDNYLLNTDQLDHIEDYFKWVNYGKLSLDWYQPLFKGFVLSRCLLLARSPLQTAYILSYVDRYAMLFLYLLSFTVLALKILRRHCLELMLFIPILAMTHSYGFPDQFNMLAQPMSIVLLSALIIFALEKRGKILLLTPAYIFFIHPYSAIISTVILPASTPSLLPFSTLVIFAPVIVSPFTRGLIPYWLYNNGNEIIRKAILIFTTSSHIDLNDVIARFSKLWLGFFIASILYIFLFYDGDKKYRQTLILLSLSSLILLFTPNALQQHSTIYAAYYGCLPILMMFSNMPKKRLFESLKIFLILFMVAELASQSFPLYLRWVNSGFTYGEIQTSRMLYDQDVTIVSEPWRMLMSQYYVGTPPILVSELSWQPRAYSQSVKIYEFLKDPENVSNLIEEMSKEYEEYYGVRNKVERICLWMGPRTNYWVDVLAVQSFEGRFLLPGNPTPTPWYEGRPNWFKKYIPRYTYLDAENGCIDEVYCFESPNSAANIS